MSETMMLVRWLPPLKTLEDGNAIVEGEMKEWVLPKEAVELIHQTGRTTALLGLIDELERDHVLHGAALQGVRDYLRFKAHEIEPGRIVSRDIK